MNTRLKYVSKTMAYLLDHNLTENLLIILKGRVYISGQQFISKDEIPNTILDTMKYKLLNAILDTMKYEHLKAILESMSFQMLLWILQSMNF